MDRKVLLILGYVWVEPTSSAAGSRMLQLIALFLKQGYQITFASAAQKGERACNLKSMGVQEATIALNCTSFDDFTKELKPTIVLFDRFMIEEQFGWRVAENVPNALRILDTEDLHSLRKMRQEALRRDVVFEVEQLLHSDIAKREISAILRCDLSFIISTFEMELLQSLFKIDENILLHLPFLLTSIDEKMSESWTSFEQRAHFITVGNFLHAPNVDAVLQLKKTIWPLVRKQLPKAEMHIYGAYITQQVLEMHAKKEGFLVKGFVKNAAAVVSKARVVLAPIRFGAGIKGKLTEAMLCGTPSVTTTIGAEGMHGDLPWNGFVADDFTTFSEKAVQLYQDKTIWKNSQKKGIEIVNKIYERTQLEKLCMQRISHLHKTLKNHRAQNFIGSLLQYQTLQSTKYMSKWIEEKNSKRSS